MTDYKQLCAELVDALDSGIPSARIRSSPLADQARDALAARRPKPPSLKEQALEDLDQIDGHAVDQLSAYVIHDDLKQRVSNIRRALEALPNE